MEAGIVFSKMSLIASKKKKKISLKAMETVTNCSVIDRNEIQVSKG